MKHNKKRNTAFLFEALISELTKSIVHKNDEKRDVTKSLISKHFRRGTNLYEELQLYKALLETHGLERVVAEKLLFEVKSQRRFIADSDVFSEQSELINDMNKEYDKGVFTTFVPNYKSLATLSQLFNSGAPIKERVLLESKIIDSLMGEEAKREKMAPVDNLVYKTFVNKFNEKYSDTLLEEQKDLLTKYISSFADNGLQLKMFLNEEIGRLKTVINEAASLEEIKQDAQMLSKTKAVLGKLVEYSKQEISEEMVRGVIKIQQLASEINS